MNVTKTISLLAVAGAFALPAASASADTLVQAAPGATNLASGGGWLAWSAPAPDGGHRLTLRAPDGTVSVPAVGKFSSPVAPAIGTSTRDVSERALLVVYERAGDLYAYNPAEQVEAKLKGVNTGARESSPQINFGRIVFTRSGAKGGVFELGSSGSGKARRIETVKPAAVAFNGSRIAYPAGRGVHLHRVSGRGADSVARATGVKDFVLTRYSLTYLTSGGKVFQTNRFGGSGDEHEIRGVKQGSTTLSPTANSIAFEGAFLRWYLDDEGLKRISTQNLFR